MLYIKAIFGLLMITGFTSCGTDKVSVDELAMVPDFYAQTITPDSLSIKQDIERNYDGCVGQLDASCNQALLSHEHTEWRYIPSLGGYRRFTPIGAIRYDVNQIERYYSPYGRRFNRRYDYFYTGY